MSDGQRRTTCSTAGKSQPSTHDLMAVDGGNYSVVVSQATQGCTPSSVSVLNLDRPCCSSNVTCNGPSNLYNCPAHELQLLEGSAGKMNQHHATSALQPVPVSRSQQCKYTLKVGDGPPGWQVYLLKEARPSRSHVSIAQQLRFEALILKYSAHGRRQRP